MKLSSLNKGLVAHWTMSQDSLKGSLLADKTPYENDGTIYGATFTTDRKGKANSAMYFDGVDDYIDCGNKIDYNLANTSHTISFWANAIGVPTFTQHLLNRFTGGIPGAGYAFYINTTGIIRYEERATDNSVSMSYSFSGLFGSWHFILVTVNNNDKIAKFYIDGNFINSDIYAGDLINYNNNLHIGGGASNNFNGSIADVRIYNRALSQAEITTLYNSYNPKIVIKTSLPKIKLYGGD